MAIAIPFGFEDRESVILNLDLPAESDSGYDCISCLVHVRAGNFDARVKHLIERRDLIPFSEAAEKLYRSLKGEAVLNSLEGHIYLKLTGDGKGHIKLQGELVDRGIENKFFLVIEYDQTLLWQSVSALRDVLMLIQTKGSSPTEPQ